MVPAEYYRLGQNVSDKGEGGMNTQEFFPFPQGQQVPAQAQGRWCKEFLPLLARRVQVRSSVLETFNGEFVGISVQTDGSFTVAELGSPTLRPQSSDDVL